MKQQALTSLVQVWNNGHNGSESPDYFGWGSGYPRERERIPRPARYRFN